MPNYADDISPPAEVAPVAPHGQGVPGVKGVAGVPDVRLMSALYKKKTSKKHAKHPKKKRDGESEEENEQVSHLYVKRSRCGHEPNYADTKDNFSLNGSFKGFSGGFSTADNSTVCDSRGNCIVRDALYAKGPAGLPNGANMGIPAGMNMGMPNSANMGIPANMNMGMNVANMQQMHGY